MEGNTILKEPSIQIWTVSLDSLRLDLCEMLNKCLCYILYSELDTHKNEPFKKESKRKKQQIHHPLTHHREKTKAGDDEMSFLLCWQTNTIHTVLLFIITLLVLYYSN